MSLRRAPPKVNGDAERLRGERAALKQQSAAVEAAATAAQATRELQPVAPPVPFDELTGTERAAGQLGVHPQAWKPVRAARRRPSIAPPLPRARAHRPLCVRQIKFMNNAHFEALMKQNALDESLARRIEAFRAVATK